MNALLAVLTVRLTAPDRSWLSPFPFSWPAVVRKEGRAEERVPFLLTYALALMCTVVLVKRLFLGEQQRELPVHGKIASRPA